MNDTYHLAECRCTKCHHVWWIIVSPSGYTWDSLACPITCSGYGVLTGVLCP